jgi:hypothetical protein
MVVLLAVCAVSLAVFVNNSSDGAAGTTTTQPYEIGEKDATTGIASVTLTEKAAERTGIQTAAVEDGSSGALAVPYSAIWYDAKGNAFVYTVTEPLTYIRAPITVDRVEGDQVILSAGPSVGTEVVTQGVAELYGAETGLK